MTGNEPPCPLAQLKPSQQRVPTPLQGSPYARHAPGSGSGTQAPPSHTWPIRQHAAAQVTPVAHWHSRVLPTFTQSNPLPQAGLHVLRFFRLPASGPRPLPSLPLRFASASA